MIDYSISKDANGYFWLVDAAGQPGHRFPLTDIDDAQLLRRVYVTGKIGLLIKFADALPVRRGFEVRPAQDMHRRGFHVWCLEEKRARSQIFKRKRDAEAARLEAEADRTDIDMRVAFTMALEQARRMERRERRTDAALQQARAAGTAALQMTMAL